MYYCLLPLACCRKMNENGSLSQHEASLKEIVEYAERLEVTEHGYGGNRKGSVVKNNGQKGKKKSRSSQDSSEVGRANDSGNRQHYKTGDCRVHEQNFGHSSHQCTVLIGHAEKVQAQWKAQPKDYVCRQNSKTLAAAIASSLGLRLIRR